MNKVYAKLLLDPQWKERRAEIILRDQNRCVECGAEDNLHVHHRYYERDKKPWEYPDEAMITLCKTCHNDKHRENFKYKWMPLYIENLDFLAAMMYLDKIGGSLFFKLLTDCQKDTNRVKVDYDDLLDFFSHFAKPGVIKRSTLVRHLKILRRNGLLSIVPGKRNDFLLNPSIIYHGQTSTINDCEFYYEYADGLILTGEFINTFLPDNTARDKPSQANT